MTSRAAAAILGLIAGIAAALTTLSQWTVLTAGMRAGSEAWAAPLSRLAWIIAISVSAFALVTLLIAMIATFVEAWRTRTQIDRLRHDPMLEGWNAADWRAAFAGTAVADHAEAAIAAIMQGADHSGESSRRVFADPALLLSLERVWLDRGTLTATLKPLPNIVLAAGALLALLHYATAEMGWEIPLAAALAGWTTITVARYVARALLSPAIEMAVRSATAAIRPLTPALALDLVVKRLAPDPGNGAASTEVALAQMDADKMAAALRAALAEPLMRIAEATNRLQSGEISTGNQVTIRREEISTGPVIDIEAALAEVRMGIERLLDTPSTSSAGPDLRDIAETIRGALAEQNDTLRQSSAALNDAAERIAASLASISEGLPGTSDTMPAVATVPSATNPAIASELKTLLREFGDR